MHTNFDILQQTRTNFLKLTAELSEGQINHIPQGFGNNIIWNLAHVVVTQQLLCYRLAKVEERLSHDFIDKYKKGTGPSGLVSPQEIELIRQLALSTVDDLREDYESGLFKNFDVYETSYGVKLASIEDALLFLNTHDAVHLGCAMTIRKLI